MRIYESSMFGKISQTHMELYRSRSFPDRGTDVVTSQVRPPPEQWAPILGRRNVVAKRAASWRVLFEIIAMGSASELDYQPSAVAVTLSKVAHAQ